MPATSDKQRRFMGAELARKRAGKSTRTKMTENQLEDFASMPMHENHTKEMGKKMKKKKAMKMESHGTMLKNVAWGDLGTRRQEEASKVGGFTDGPVVKTAGKI